MLVKVTLPFVAAPECINKDISTFVPARATIARGEKSAVSRNTFCNIAGNNCSVHIHICFRLACESVPTPVLGFFYLFLPNDRVAALISRFYSYSTRKGVRIGDVIINYRDKNDIIC